MAKKKSNSSSSEKSDDLLQFLRKVNRPHSANDMCTHLQGKYTKATIGKALDKLIDQDLVVSKTFGKSVIYTIKQEKPNEDEDDQSLDKELTSIREALDILCEENRRRQQVIAKLKMSPKTENAKTQLEDIKASMVSMKQQLDEFKAKGAVQISLEERQRIDKELAVNRKLWSQRKKLFKEILGAMMENMPLKKNELLEEIDFQEDSIPFEQDPLAS